jgi:hypothetical protein
MRRVIIFQKWKAAWWREQVSVQIEGDTTILSGIAGYANKQAAICEHLGVKCALRWLPQLKAKGVIPGWAAEYEVLLSQAESPDDEDTELEDDDFLQEDIEDELFD